MLLLSIRLFKSSWPSESLLALYYYHVYTRKIPLMQSKLDALDMVQRGMNFTTSFWAG